MDTDQSGSSTNDPDAGQPETSNNFSNTDQPVIITAAGVQRTAI
jgi:hypothetical protein